MKPEVTAELKRQAKAIALRENAEQLLQTLEAMWLDLRAGQDIKASDADFVAELGELVREAKGESEHAPAWDEYDNTEELNRAYESTTFNKERP